MKIYYEPKWLPLRCKFVKSSERKDTNENEEKIVLNAKINTAKMSEGSK